MISDNLQLAKTVDMRKIKFPARAERKMDGVRLFFIDKAFYTRSGKLVPLPKTLNAMDFAAASWMIDIEVTLESGKMIDRATVSGMINSAMKGGSIDESLLRFNVIDTMLSKDYYNENCSERYMERLPNIHMVINNNKQANFRTIPYTEVNSFEKLEALYEQELQMGYEGLVVKHYGDKYKFKRSADWARFKAAKTADLLCIGYHKGKLRSKYEDMIGALALKGIVEGKHIEVKVGSGLTDFLRSQSPGYFVNKTIEVKYNSITRSKTTGKASLFLPRFVCIREDK